MPEVTSLVYSNGNNSLQVVLDSNVVSTLCDYRQLKGKGEEAGGQLFANFNNSSVHVKFASIPGGNDRRWWSRFIPDRLREQREIDKQFSSGLHFVGDWHTHPQKKPSYSKTDLETVQDCFRKSKHELRALLMVIIGYSKLPEGIGVWVVDENTCSRLTLRNSTDDEYT